MITRTPGDVEALRDACDEQLNSDEYVGVVPTASAMLDLCERLLAAEAAIAALSER